MFRDANSMGTFFFSRLPIGYVCHKNGKIDSLEWIDFEFYNDNSGDDGNPPKELEFKFKAGKRFKKHSVGADPGFPVGALTLVRWGGTDTGPFW